MTPLPKNWLFLGVGYCAKALIHHLPDGLNLAGTSRNPDEWPQSLKARVKGLTFDGGKPKGISHDLKHALSEAEVLIMSQPPSAAGDPFLTAIHSDIKDLMPRVKWAGYLSATSLYGERAGGWAYEHDGPRPKSQRGRYRAEAELAWLETGLPVHIFRLAGIYGGAYFGQSRSPFERIRTGQARAVVKPGHVVNRIHVDDIVSAVLSSIAAPAPLQIYNVSDGNPAPPQDVLCFAARLCGADLPPKVNVDSSEISEMSRSFYAETKRVSIDKLKERLDWRPQFSAYQSGLISIYKSEMNWPDVVIFAGHVDVPKARRHIIAQALPRHIELSRQEPGCLRFDIEADEQIAGRYHIHEVFKTPADFKAHQNRCDTSPWAAAIKGLDGCYLIFMDGV